jgi:hypothetical protein
MSTVDREFVNQRVVIDGGEFVRCRFIACTFVYSGGPPPRFDQCAIDNPKFVFEGAAQNTLGVLAGLYHGGFKTMVEGTFQSIRKSESVDSTGLGNLIDGAPRP